MAKTAAPEPQKPAPEPALPQAGGSYRPHPETGELVRHAETDAAPPTTPLE